jgi:hypothetical protein
MNYKKLTGIFIGLIILLCVVYDIFAFYRGDNTTISQWFWANSKSYPFIPFCFGILMGHLFTQGT